MGCGFVCFVVLNVGSAVLNVGSAVLNVGSAVLNGEVSVVVWFCLFRCVEWDLLCVVLGVVAQPRNCGCVDVPCSAVFASRWACVCDLPLVFVSHVAHTGRVVRPRVQRSGVSGCGPHVPCVVQGCLSESWELGPYVASGCRAWHVCLSPCVQVWLCGRETLWLRVPAAV